MALIRYNPWQEMTTLQRQLDHLFNDSLSGDNWQKCSNLSKVPAAELTETSDTFELLLEVHGMKAEDLDIQVTAKQVAISGERKSSTKTSENGTTKSEFYYGRFQRVIPLPKQIQNTNVTANYQDGILSLTLPKSEEEKNQVVKVNLVDTNQ